MILKRIEMQGFKSFADKVVINFSEPVIGVVGPNGCGKSNISDAIRWVLGEQSAKSLRGDKMTDVIFNGSETRKGVNMAEVSLIFDNTKRFFASEEDEIEITRRIYRTGDDAEYLINKKNVRYKDIVELILDTGLGKDSLSMISQGNVTSFAEAKPYERRAIFEEAAGVSKYKKRKIESLAKLERTKENLDRTYDILQEIEKQLLPLERQAKKAKLYKEKKKRLEEIEIAVLVDEINYFNECKQDVEKQIFDIETTIAMHKTSINVQENSNSDLKLKNKQLEKDIDNIQDNLSKIINEIHILESKKIEVDEKRKYVMEMGSSKEKITHLKQMLEEAKFELEDRLNRYQTLTSEIQLETNNLQEISRQLIESSLKKEENINLVNRYVNRCELLQNIIKDPFSSRNQQGVKAILDNINSFYGVMGVVGKLIQAESSYEEAISSALAGSIYHIVTKDEQAARKCIEFLKNNKSGKATFLPLSVLKEKYIRQEDEVICQSIKGYLGPCSEFVECKPEFDSIRYNLLGNTLMCDTLENANYLASILKYQYKIVTLDGDIVHVGGSMTGGKIKNETSFVTAQAELNRINQELVSYRAKQELSIKEYNNLVIKKERIESLITEKRISIAQLEPIIDAKKSKFEKLKTDFELINPDGQMGEEVVLDEVTKNLSLMYQKRDELSNSLKIKRDEKHKLSQEIEHKEIQMKDIRKLYDEQNSKISDISRQKAILETKLETNLSRLASEYQMTYQWAKQNVEINLTGDEKEEVGQLRREISNLGNINMNACEEYEEISNRYDFLKKNYDDLIESRDKILDAINQMDDVMKQQFIETFDAINKELPNTFTKLFGGGKAKLVMEDPNDVLNTGIDIDFQPPGKQVSKIKLLSGGEKTLIAISVLFTILKIKGVPLVVFDEIEAALDQANVEKFAKYVKEFEADTQFIIITHRPGTMSQCNVLYGVTMQNRGVSQMIKVHLVDALNLAEDENIN